MRLDRIHTSINYNDLFGLKRALGILENEIAYAISKKNKSYAFAILDIAQKIMDHVAASSIDVLKKNLWSQKLKKFVSVLHKKVADEL